jgi:hypothetical protein
MSKLIAKVKQCLGPPGAAIGSHANKAPTARFLCLRQAVHRHQMAGVARTRHFECWLVMQAKVIAKPKQYRGH